MNKIRIILMCTVFIICSCSTKSQESTIRVELENIGNDTINLILLPFDKEPSFENPIEIVVEDGVFVLDTLIDKLHYGIILHDRMYETLSDGNKLLMYSKAIDFFVEPNIDVSVKGEILKAKSNYIFSGNTLNSQFLKYKKYISKYSVDYSILNFKCRNDYLNTSLDKLTKRLRFQEYRKVQDSYKKKTISFIKENPNYEISAYLLTKLKKEKNKNIISLYSDLSYGVRNSDFGMLIQGKINIWNSVTTNNLAPDFESITLSNNKIKLSNQRGKYIVLDFWGTWCKPCMSEMPMMKELYNNNRDKVEIIGVACRDNKVNLERVILENELNWKHILNDQQADDLVKKFGVTGYPTKIIINPKGIIEGIFLGRKDEFFIEMNNLLNDKITTANNK